MTDKEIEECYNNCIEYCNKIKSPILKECCQEIYSNYKEKLINKPAIPGRHHYFKGGLLYHIYCVTRNSYNIANMYPNLNIDMDLILFGALLHDIGKTNEYNNFIKDETYIKDNKTIFIESQKTFKANLTKILKIYFSNAYIYDNNNIVEYPVYYGNGEEWINIKTQKASRSIITEDGKEIKTEDNKIIEKEEE